MKSTVRKASNGAVVILGVCFLLMSFAKSSVLSNRANVTIPANQEFVLGEFQNSSYKAKLKNASNALIEISVVDKETNEQTQGFGLDGKGEATVSISKNEKVLLKNPNDEEVLVRVTLNKNVEGMRYQEMSAFEGE